VALRMADPLASSVFAPEVTRQPCSCVPSFVNANALALTLRLITLPYAPESRGRPRVIATYLSLEVEEPC
jgi:hypothetical protein